MVDELDITDFIKSLGMDQSRSIRRACADFYILERLSQSDRTAARLLDTLEKTLAREFSAYYDIAVGGELRYLLDEKKVKTPERLKPYIDAVHDYLGNRERAWRIWTQTRKDVGPESVEWFIDAQTAFNDPGWHSRSAGGPKWGLVAKVEYDWLKGRLSRRMFIDRGFTIEHNHGAVFDKVYSVHDLDFALKLQADNEYDKLVNYTSPEVKSLWKKRRRAVRQEYSPLWLGRLDEGDEDS